MQQQGERSPKKEEQKQYWPIFKETISETNKFWSKFPIVESQIVLVTQLSRLGKKKQTQAIYNYSLLSNGTLYYETIKDKKFKGHVKLSSNFFIKIVQLQSTNENIKVIRIRKYQNLQIYVWDKDPKITFQWANQLKQFCISQNFDLIYDIGKLIGKGGFAKVFAVTHKKDLPLGSLNGCTLAAKVYSKDHLISKGDIRKFYNMIICECNLLRTIKSPYILSLNEIIQLEDALVLISEYLPQGSLYDHLKNNGQFTQEQSLDILYQLSLGLNAIHEQIITFKNITRKGFVHRDVKLENIMIASKDPIQIRLIDFGFAELINEKKLKSGQGTAGYIAPEVFQLKPFTRKSEVFSIGVVFYALLSNSSPFRSNTYEGLLEQNKLCQINFDRQKFEKTSDWVFEILQSLLEPNPDNRMNLNELISQLKTQIVKYNTSLEESQFDSYCSESENVYEDENEEYESIQFQNKTFHSFYRPSQPSMEQLNSGRQIMGGQSNQNDRKSFKNNSQKSCKIGNENEGENSQSAKKIMNYTISLDRMDSDDDEMAIEIYKINSLKVSYNTYNNKKWIE